MYREKNIFGFGDLVIGNYQESKNIINLFIKNIKENKDLELLDYFINSKSIITKKTIEINTNLKTLLELDEKISMVDWNKFEKTNLFSRAALTRYNELKSLNIKEKNILIKRIDSSYHLEFYWNTFLKKFKSIKLLEIFSHGKQQNGYPEMNGTFPKMDAWDSIDNYYTKNTTSWFWDETEWSKENYSGETICMYDGNNKLNFSKNAIIGFYGCHTSKGAKKYSKKFKEIITFGQGFGAVFSQKKNLQVDIKDNYTGPVYLQDCASKLNYSLNLDYPGEIYINGKESSYKESLEKTGLYPK